MSCVRLGTLKAISATAIAASLFCLQDYAIAAAAPAYPSKSILLVIPYEAGASIDIVGQKIAGLLSKRLNTPVVVEYRVGGGGIVGTERVARAPADGYTLLVQNPSLLTTAVLQKLPYDLKSFAPVAKLASGVNGLVVNSKVEANSVKELIALAKQRPGKLLFVTTAVGASAHFGAELFKIMAGIDVKIVHFKGSGQAFTDLLGGHSDITSTSITNVLPQVKSGRVKLLATAGLKRSAMLPDVPTISESGVPGYEHVNWWGMLAPAGVPGPVLSRLTSELKAILDDDETKKWFETQGADIDFLITTAFAADLAKEQIRWADVAKRANIGSEDAK